MIKQIFSWFVFIVLFAFVIVGFASRKNITHFLSKSMVSQASPEIKKTIDLMVDSLYNYSSNGLMFEIAFLEFGAKGCSDCRQMEVVMREIQERFPEKVNVEFLNIMEAKNQELMKYYGVVTIPTQVLLDNKGNEYFRHSGFLSTTELSKVIVAN